MISFKVGDRVRDLETEAIGTVDAIDPGHHKSVRVTFRTGAAPWYFWFHPTELQSAGTPMSPEARMVWHAMRAGAKRVNGRVFVMGVRKREYAGHGGDIQLVVYGDYPARKDGGS